MAIVISEDQWITSYEPITHSPIEIKDRMMPEQIVWTLVEAEGKLYLLNGYREVNKIGYHLTMESWKAGQEIEVSIND